MQKDSKTRILVEGALMVAIASVLSVFPKFSFLPNGGSVTFCSMLPIIVYSYRRGLKWGFAAGFVFALVQCLNFKPAGLSPAVLITELLFDYLIAFTVLGIGGIFRGKMKSVRSELLSGTCLALFLRFVSHLISGYFLFGEWAEWFFSELGDWGASILERYAGNALVFIYSAVYNASFMLPELIITCIAAWLIAPSVLVYMEKPEE